MTILTEPIGSFPKPLQLIDATAARETAFAKICAWVLGRAFAAEQLGAG